MAVEALREQRRELAERERHEAVVRAHRVCARAGGERAVAHVDAREEAEVDAAVLLDDGLGEAAAARDQFKNLAAEDRRHLVDFVGSL